MQLSNYHPVIAFLSLYLDEQQIHKKTTKEAPTNNHTPITCCRLSLKTQTTSTSNANTNHMTETAAVVSGQQRILLLNIR